MIVYTTLNFRLSHRLEWQVHRDCRDRTVITSIPVENNACVKEYSSCTSPSLSLSSLHIDCLYPAFQCIIQHDRSTHGNLCNGFFYFTFFEREYNESHIERRYLHHLSHQQFKHDKSEYSTCIYIQSFFIHHSRSFLPLMYSVFSLRPTHDSYAVFSLFLVRVQIGLAFVHRNVFELKRKFVHMTSGGPYNPPANRFKFE